MIFRGKESKVNSNKSKLGGGLNIDSFLPLLGEMILISLAHLHSTLKPAPQNPTTLMVQKSHSQPPFGCIKPCKQWDKVQWAPKTMKNKGFGHLKTKLFTIKRSKHVGLGGPWYQTQLVSWISSITKIPLHL